MRSLILDLVSQKVLRLVFNIVIFELTQFEQKVHRKLTSLSIFWVTFKFLGSFEFAKMHVYWFTNSCCDDFLQGLLV